MIEIGRICIKLAGRDAGMKCVVVDMLGSNMVMIDGQTRRRKCSIRHLEPLENVLKIKKGASHSEIAAEFKKLKIETKESKPRKAAEKPMKVRKSSEKSEEEKSAKAAKKQAKEEKKKEKKAEPKKAKKHIKKK
ncbi:MAG: 50S ribosomal protein L14e [Candidatus Woesearchaeota archaeon]|nr:50S ribosomal protein L14e [Candidatus Woesearchaeota archaeon]